MIFHDKYYLIDERSGVNASPYCWVSFMGRRALIRVQADSLLKNKEEGFTRGPAKAEQEKFLID